MTPEPVPSPAGGIESAATVAPWMETTRTPERGNQTMNTTVSPSTVTIPELVAIVRPFSSKNKRTPALRDALVQFTADTTSVTATDLEVAGTVTLRTPGVVPCSILVEAATCHNVAERDPLEFPAVASMGGAEIARVILTVTDVRRIADHVATATDPDSSRYALGGVLIERPERGMLVAVGTDGRRLHALRILPAAADGSPRDGSIVPAGVFSRFVTAVRAAARVGLGLAGRRLAAAVEAGEVAMTFSESEVGLAWGSACGTISVRVGARLIEGRFPRWRDCVPPAAEVTAPTVVNGPAVAAACREIAKATAEAAKAAAAAWVAEEAAKGRRVYATGVNIAHPRGAQFGAAGIAGRGCEVVRPVCSTPAVLLDPVFAADAVEAAVEVGGHAVDLRITDAQSAVGVFAREWQIAGPGFLAVVMPMAQD